MRPSELLKSGLDSDDQVLETDVMRFLAMIGVVFWIIFSIVEYSPPQQSVLTTSYQMDMPSQSIPSDPETLPSEKKEPLQETEKPGEAEKHIETAAELPKDNPTQKTQQEQQGLEMQFRSIDDLMALIRQDRVEVFMEAKATGFHLYFAALLQNDEVSFDTIEQLPQKLWEIKSGSDYAYFIERLCAGYPSIKSFSESRVFVFFSDEALEQKFDEKIAELADQKASGTVSITGDGGIIYEKNYHN